MEKNLVFLFCLESMLGGIIKALENKDKEEIIRIVTVRAERDTLTGGRFSKSYRDKRDEYSEKIKTIIKRGDVLSSTKLIRELMINKESDINLGYIQKFVNMTLKYFLVIQFYGYGEYVPNVCIEDCDCPLDSIILDTLEKEDKIKRTRWTKIEKLEEYENIQNIIKECYGSKIEYDFQKWHGGM